MTQNLDCRTPRERVGGALYNRMVAGDGATRRQGEGMPTVPRYGSARPDAPLGGIPRRTDPVAAAVPPTDHTGIPLAMVYSPYQPFDDLYEPEEALETGTLFRGLNFPFYPTPCNRGGEGQ